MTTISLRQADALAALMKQHSAYKATTETVVIHGIEATVVVLDHVDREESKWQSVHVLGYVNGSVDIGNIPSEEAPEQ